MIEPVYHIQAIGMQSRKKKILDALHDIGMLHITVLEDENLHRDKPIEKIDDISSALLELQWMLKQLRSSQDLHTFSGKSLKDTLKSYAAVRKKVFVPLQRLSKEKEELRKAKNKYVSILNQNDSHAFAPYAQRRGHYVHTYVVRMTKEQYENTDLPGYHTFEQGRVLVVCKKADAGEVENALNGFEWVQASPIGKKQYSSASKKLPKLKKKIDAVEKKIRGYQKYLNEIHNLVHDLTIYFDRYSIADSMLTTRHTFMFEGYVGLKDHQHFERIAKKFSINIIAKKPADAPSKLRNRIYVKHFDFLIKMFGVPRYGYYDPTFLLSIFFPLFFGLMFSDVGYGIMLTGLALLLARKAKPYQKVMKDGAVVLASCALMTVVFGLLFGSFFSGLIPIQALLFNPFENTQMLLMMVLGFGLLHITLGLVINSYQYLSKNMYKRFLTEPLPMLILIGMGVAFGVGFSVLGYVMLGSVILLLYMKSKIMGMLDISGIFGNWMSYARLMALAMATGGIGMAINILAENVLALGMLGSILYVLLLVGGHIFNFVMNILGSSIHAIRLHYIEFFAQFYAGGGEEFKSYSTKREIETL